MSFGFLHSVSHFMFIRSIIRQSLFISSGCNFAEKFRTKRDAVFCDGPTSIYLQKPASIQPRTSLSKFGGKFNPFFIRHLAGKRTERRLRGALERGPRLGGCRDRSGLASSHQTWSVMIRKKSTISWTRILSFLVSSWQGIILRTSSAGTQFRSFERTQSSAKWYAVRYEVEGGRRERLRWWWRCRGCLYT